MKNICLIGAGNIGSRHLQGLKKVSSPLSIEVVDPSVESLRTAQQRYEEINSTNNHKVTFIQNIQNLSKKIDLVIIATSSNVRRQVLEQLLKNSEVKYLILEKILFQKKEDYSIVEKLLKRKGVKSWVNFSMRTMPFYQNLKGKFKSNIQMIVSGSQYGLITNAIHFIDYIAYLTGCYDFKVVTQNLDPKLISSKRPGFSELNGTLAVYFMDGSTGLFTCYANNEAPFIIEVQSSAYRCISKESERRAYISSSEGNWNWKEMESDIPYQSNMTNIVVEEIFKSGKCPLASYQEASKIHLQFLESLLKLLNQSKSKKVDFYPFT